MREHFRGVPVREGGVPSHDQRHLHQDLANVSISACTVLATLVGCLFVRLGRVSVHLVDEYDRSQFTW